jgi:hypothetical protein
LSIKTGNGPPLREAEGEGEMKPVRVEYHLNDDKSPLIGLLNCIVCKETTKIEKSTPDAEGRDIIQYRCRQCGRIELVRLFRRSARVGPCLQLIGGFDLGAIDRGSSASAQSRKPSE